MRLFILIALALSLSISVFSQENGISAKPKEQRPIAPKEFNTFKERLYFGGNIGLGFGTTTYINLSPLVGCKITKQFSAGGGIVYNYFSQTYGAKKYVSTIYGVSAFARYMVLENLFAQVGLDRLNVMDYSASNSRIWIDNILIGGGYRQAISGRGSLVASIFYNINDTPLSPYQNPIIQIGFNVGL
jgi:hypothetical protein